MSADPLADVVSSQYQKWRYPEPIVDLPAWLAGNWQWFDPSHAHRMFWPDRPYRPDIDILVAGCGTNQAAVFAYSNPGARVLAIDVSQPSLEHHAFLRDKYGMQNLELRMLPIEEVRSLGRDFDLIVSTGVLHHLADPLAGLRALSNCLRPDGVAAIMLYARYGRIGVEMMQSVFREIGLHQDEAALAMVKQALTLLPPEHPVQSYMSLAPDLKFDAGLVDTFLHGRDRSYTVDDCLGLITSAGLVFQEWFLKAPYYPSMPPESGFYATVAALPEPQKWSVMERINASNGCHFFTACRTDRPRETYQIDFASPAIFDAIPEFRYRCGITGNTIFRPDWRTNVAPAEAVLVQLVDGRKTIREIVAKGATTAALETWNEADREELARIFFQSLWQRDFLALGLPSLSGRGR